MRTFLKIGLTLAASWIVLSTAIAAGYWLALPSKGFYEWISIGLSALVFLGGLWFSGRGAALSMGRKVGAFIGLAAIFLFGSFWVALLTACFNGSCL